MRILIILGVSVTLIAIALVAGVVNLRLAIRNELEESAKAILELNQGYTIHDAAKEPLESLELPAPILKSLQAAGMKTIGDLTAKSQIEVAAIDGMDPPAMREVVAALAKKGLSLSKVG